MEKTTVNITFETDQSIQLGRVVFESLQRAVRDQALDHDLDLLSQLLIAAMKDENERWDEEKRIQREQLRESDIGHAVRAGVNQGIADDDRPKMGTHLADMIENALKVSS